MNETDRSWVIRWTTFMVVCTLCLVVLSVVAALLKGLFDPIVDNKEIFGIIGPGFMAILGYFGGFLHGRDIPPKNSSSPTP